MVEIFKKLSPIFLILGGCFSNPPVITTVSEIKSPEQNNQVQRTFDPIKGITAKDWRPDPFESHTKLVVQEIPARELVLNRRLAPLSLPSSMNFNSNENTAPLPFFQRRVAGIMYNGAITAILETIVDDQIIHEVISPGSKVFSGVKNIELTVHAITNEFLILKSNDNRTVKVSLSGAPPNVLNNLKNLF